MWISYLSSGWHPLAWIGVVLVCAAICLGICTVTLWTPYPVRPDPEAGREDVDRFERRAAPARPGDPAGEHQDVFTVTDEMIASLLAEPSPPPGRSRVTLLPLMPVGSAPMPRRKRLAKPRRSPPSRLDWNRLRWRASLP